MEKWFGKVALVTGASSGIGASIAQELAKEGMVVIGVARRLDKLKELQNKLGKIKGSLHIKQFDITKLDEIPKLFEDIKKEFGGVDVLINNAGTVRTENLLTESKTKNMVDVITTNVLAVAVASREAIAQMKAKDQPAHIININSLAGHKVILAPGFNLEMYTPSKYALTAVSEISRFEMANQGTKIKITNLSPGTVESEMYDFVYGSYKDMMDQTFVSCLNVSAISDAVKYILGTPETVLISQLTIKHIREEP